MAFNFPASPSIGQIYSSNGARFIWDGTKWKAVALDTQTVIGGQVQLTLVSASTLRLVPFNGFRILIGGQERQIPLAGIDLVASGLTPGGIYFIYAYWTGSAVALELSTTSYSRDAGSGIMVKTGDASRTLVGMSRAQTAAEWGAQSSGNGGVGYYLTRSWYNDPGIYAGAGRPSQADIATTAVTTLNNNVYVLPWPNEVVTVRLITPVNEVSSITNFTTSWIYRNGGYWASSSFILYSTGSGTHTPWRSEPEAGHVMLNFAEMASVSSTAGWVRYAGNNAAYQKLVAESNSRNGG